MRVQRTSLPGHSKEVRYCDHPGCLETTRERKPYCSEHVLENPYAVVLVTETERHELEIAGGKEGKDPVDPNGTVAADVLGWIRQNGASTAGRIGRVLTCSEERAEWIMKGLERSGLLVLSRTRRGSLFADLAES